MKANSKRRRTNKQIRIDKEAARQKEEETERKLSQFNDLQAQVERMQQQMNNGEAAANLMSQMINAGVMQQTE